MSKERTEGREVGGRQDKKNWLIRKSRIKASPTNLEEARIKVGWRWRTTETLQWFHAGMTINFEKSFVPEKAKQPSAIITKNYCNSDSDRQK